MRRTKRDGPRPTSLYMQTHSPEVLDRHTATQSGSTDHVEVVDLLNSVLHKCYQID